VRGRSKRLDQQRATEIRLVLIKPRPLDIGWMSGIQRPARLGRPILSAAASLVPKARSRRWRGHGHDKALGGLGKDSGALRATRRNRGTGRLLTSRGNSRAPGQRRGHRDGSGRRRRALAARGRRR
jgi:hypothetical protein